MCGKRCAACDDPFTPRRNVPNQAFCSKPECQRERMVENPGLFLKALQSKQETTDGKPLAEGPEGLWCRDLAVIGKILSRLLHQVPTLFAPQQEPIEKKCLQQVFVQIKGPLQRLESRIDEACVHDPLYTQQRNIEF